MNVHVHVEAVAKSSSADSVKMNDSMLGAASSPSEAEKGEKVDVDQAERRRALIAEMKTMRFPAPGDETLW